MIPHGYEIRPALSTDIARLPEIERAAGLLFKTYPGELARTEEMFTHVTSIEVLDRARQAGHLWVAVAPPGDVVGFALVRDVEGYAHLDELDVMPLHGQRGLGSELLETVCAWARDAGYATVTLRTFRDVPWNGPFYQSRGFRVVDSADLSTKHVELETLERGHGLRTDLRVTMSYQTAGSHPNGADASSGL